MTFFCTTYHEDPLDGPGDAPQFQSKSDVGCTFGLAVCSKVWPDSGPSLHYNSSLAWGRNLMQRRGQRYPCCPAWQCSSPTRLALASGTLARCTLALQAVSSAQARSRWPGAALPGHPGHRAALQSHPSISSTLNDGGSPKIHLSS